MPEVGGAGLRIGGINRLKLTLSRLDTGVKQRVILNALAAAARPAVTATRRKARALGKRGGETVSQAAQRKRFAKHKFAPYRLADAITTRRRRYQGTGMVVFGSAYSMSVAGGRGRIGHLVEEGHRKFVFGHDTGERVGPHRFMKPAWDENKGRAQAILVAKLRTGIEKEAKKARAK